ncbi:hypothetical protein KZP23_22320 [Echinicola marina]|uniref:hypothetical protein n=1 Tax=Echinicola marina TaxID=2859768 RepID=UPI001CF65424|nr:hypothetical protein [Echinicola marina]UCS93346.1 hypothetical protein KZP23_22320 [Echinicola marina]
MMKKLILMFAMVFMAFSSSFAYNNEEMVEAYYSNNTFDSKNVNINSYSTFNLSYSIERVSSGAPNYDFNGRVAVKNNGVTIFSKEVDLVGSPGFYYEQGSNLSFGWNHWGTITIEAEAISNVRSYAILMW